MDRKEFQAWLSVVDGLSAAQKAEEMEVLAEPVLEVLKTEVSLGLPRSVDGEELTEADIERVDKALRIKADASARRRLLIRQKIVDICESDPTHSVLYFGASVADAATVAFLIRERGHRAAFVSGDTPDPVRRALIDEFRRGEVRLHEEGRVQKGPAGGSR